MEFDIQDIKQCISNYAFDKLNPSINIYVHLFQNVISLMCLLSTSNAKVIHLMGNNLICVVFSMATMFQSSSYLHYHQHAS